MGQKVQAFKAMLTRAEEARREAGTIRTRVGNARQEYAAACAAAVVAGDEMPSAPDTAEDDARLAELDASLPLLDAGLSQAATEAKEELIGEIGATQATAGGKITAQVNAAYASMAAAFIQLGALIGDQEAATIPNRGSRIGAALFTSYFGSLGGGTRHGAGAQKIAEGLSLIFMQIRDTPALNILPVAERVASEEARLNAILGQ